MHWNSLLYYSSAGGRAKPEEQSVLVTFASISESFLQLLRNQPALLRELTPGRFEDLVLERLERQGFKVEKTGNVNAKDGGIDLIAVPKVRTVGSTLLAVQVKHHRGEQKTGRPAVDRLLAWRGSPFSLGLVVTNTEFTTDARWVADHGTNPYFIRLRDEEDLKRWIADDFSHEGRELPQQVELAPGVVVTVPRSEGSWVEIRPMSEESRSPEQ